MPPVAGRTPPLAAVAGDTEVVGGMAEVVEGPAGRRATAILALGLTRTITGRRS